MHDLRGELGIEPGKTVVGYLVRMTIQKDPFTLIRAVAEVAKTTRDIQFLCIGDGDLKQASIDLARELNVSDMIKFHAFRTDIPEVLNTFDIYTLPSLWEGLPIGMLEAMAMRKAVIATPVDGSKEAIREGQNGMLVPCKNPEALAEAILRLHHSKEMRNVLGENARDTVEKIFDVRMMVRNNENLYRELRPNFSRAAA